MAGTYACFYWSDWLSDPELRSCSVASRSLWMDMLCLAGLSVENRGFVVIGEKPATTAQLAKIFGEPEEVVQAYLDELENNGVFSRDRLGRIYSRRICRDTKRIRASSKGGKRGGAESFRKRSGIHSKTKTQENYNTANACNNYDISSTPIPTCDSNTKYQIPNTKAPLPPVLEKRDSKGKDASRLATLSKLLNLDYNRHPLGTIAYVNQLVDLERSGIDIEADLIPCIEAMKAEGRRIEGKQFSYFRQPAISFQSARKIMADIQHEIETAEPISVPEHRWPQLIMDWLFHGWWDMRTGPAPVQDGCRAPPQMAVKAAAIWNGKLGQRPFSRLLDRFYVPVWWPDSEQYFGKNLNEEDMRGFLATGIDPRSRPPGMTADNVVPLRRAM